jgi:hypothetical protein
MRLPARWILLIVLVVPAWARATLIIGISRGDSLYLASDGQGTTDSGGKAPYAVQKIFQVSPTWCASITGWAGGFLENTNLTAFPSILAKICSQETQNHLTPNEVFSQFASEYSNYFASTVFKANIQEWRETTLSFWGYDLSKNAFFDRGSVFRNGSNEVTLSVYFERPLGSKPSIGFAGQSMFLSHVMAPFVTNALPVDSYAAFRSDTVLIMARELFGDGEIRQDRMIEHILTMFDLHKKQAHSAFPEEGAIDEPYTIYRITKQGTVKAFPKL